MTYFMGLIFVVSQLSAKVGPLEISRYTVLGMEALMLEGIFNTVHVLDVYIQIDCFVEWKHML